MTINYNQSSINKDKQSWLNNEDESFSSILIVCNCNN